MGLFIEMSVGVQIFFMSGLGGPGAPGEKSLQNTGAQNVHAAAMVAYIVCLWLVCPFFSSSSVSRAVVWMVCVGGGGGQTS